MAVFGAAYTAIVCWALGRLLFRGLGVSLYRGEHDLLAALVGAPLLSTAVFLLCCLHLASAPMFLAFAPLPFLAWRGSPRVAFAALPRFWTWLFGAAFVFYSVIYLSTSLAPELSPDGMSYHLGLVSRYFRLHGFERVTANMYSNLSQGVEMLFLFAFAFGRHSAAATVHCIFLLTLPFLMLSYARRIGHVRSGVCGGLLVYLSPLAGIDGASAYNDVALAATAFGVFYLVEIWRESGARKVAIPIGLLAGFCFAIKYTGFVAVIYVAVVLGRACVPALISAGCVAAPWLAKNWLWLGNPFSPFLNRWFPNPYIHVSFENTYRNHFHTYGLSSLKPLFWMITVSGELGGQIGPLFLLAPLALLALRTQAGRRILFAAGFFLLPYPANIGARFLLPALPFISLGMALAIEASPALSALLMAAALICAWPRVIDKYRAPAGGWQIASVPWKAALHIVPPDVFLRQHSSDYVLAETIDRAVPDAATLWSSRPLAEAYIRPNVLVNYYSAEGEAIQDALLTPVLPDMQPLWNLQFRFLRRSMRHVRVIQNATSPEDIWSIGEIQFFDGTTRVRPARASAKPFPWDIGFALDDNSVTRWRSWESIHPGMHVDFDFAQAVELDRIELHCSHDQWKIDLRLEGIDAVPEKLELPPGADLRALATHTIGERGIGYLLIGDESPAAPDVRRNPARWNLTSIAEQGTAQLYKIDERILPRR